MNGAEKTSKMNVDASKLLGVSSLGVKVGLKTNAVSARSIGTAVGAKGGKV